jgi:hypothetical protein
LPDVAVGVGCDHHAGGVRRGGGYWPVLSNPITRLFANT